MRQRILIVRNDRLGDAILALPAVLLLKALFPTSEIYFWANPTVAPLIRCVSGIERVLCAVEGNDAQLLRQLRDSGISTAYCLYATARNAFTLLRSSIPDRVGTARRWFSFAFNRRVNLRRRGEYRHEALLNLDLIAVDRGNNDYLFPEIEIPEHAMNAGDRLLKSAGIEGIRPLVIIHPGSGNSAVNWSSVNFQKLAVNLALNSNVDAVVTGITSEQDLCTEVAHDNPANFCGRTNLIEMAALIKRATLLISNSTGPLHLAVALGCKVIGLYPPRADCLPDRWGPYGHPEWAITPDLQICQKCMPSENSPCRCMEEISPDQVYTKALELIGL